MSAASVAAVGLCNEFGPQILPGCDHPMTAAGGCCTCAHCGARCTGRFKGCAAVWARGPLPESLRQGPTPAPSLARPRPRPEAGEHEATVGTGPEPAGAHFSDLDSLKASLDGLGREVGRLSRHLDELGDPQAHNGSDPLVTGAIRVVLEELSALTQEVRAQRTSPGNHASGPNGAPGPPPCPATDAADLPPPAQVRLPRGWSRFQA